LDAARSRGHELVAIGELNPQLPFMPNDAVVATSEFDVLLETGSGGHPLFALPNRAVSLPDYAIGLRVAGLVNDGGTLQIGIGSLGDAIAWALGTRRRDNKAFQMLLDSLAPHVMPNETDDLSQGLYGASEMLVEGFLHLQECGVLRREVDGGIFLHAGFYLGSARFYERLRTLRDEVLDGISMTRISFTNSLRDDFDSKREQRRDARFVNTAMMVTLSGAAVSDALANGQVVSGVGGQYDFVAMAPQLDRARSIIVLPATRTRRGKTTSNIVSNYGHITIPSQLRDLVVTEYGVADLRGASDQEIVAALLKISDSRFQEGLRKHAVAAGKLSATYRIPVEFCDNSPARLERAFAASGLLTMLPHYPLGTDLTEVEAELAVALKLLSAKRGRLSSLARLALRGWRLADDPQLSEALERMKLRNPKGLQGRVERALVAAAIADARASGRSTFAPPA
ncbi:MAG: acetyl-CoA hydrolase, partial [Myxococcales bacterium]|nr:acetyl-CoA hydrolase [Deltaproteobacteria bacterium]NNL24148.1 acetyl-CoA hydrolase [Myxococcales bacterium]